MGEKLPVVDGGRLVRALKRAGFELVRIRGSAHIMEVEAAISDAE